MLHLWANHRQTFQNLKSAYFGKYFWQLNPRISRLLQCSMSHEKSGLSMDGEKPTPFWGETRYPNLHRSRCCHSHQFRMDLPIRKPQEKYREITTSRFPVDSPVDSWEIPRMIVGPSGPWDLPTPQISRAHVARILQTQGLGTEHRKTLHLLRRMMDDGLLTEDHH